MRSFTNPVFLVALLVMFLASTPAAASDQDTDSAPSPDQEQSALEQRAEQVVGLLNGEIDPQIVFNERFLAAVPPEQFVVISRQLTAQFGAALALESLTDPSASRSPIAIRMERVIAKGTIGVGPNGKLNELLLQSFEPIDDTVAKIEADLAALPGHVSWWFGPLHEGEPVLSNTPTRQMALGSTFKLYVLATLAREVAQAKRNWSDTVTLSDTRSFPSGMMQDWPSDAPITLMTLANLMISISDNTATDMLIDELGRDAIQQTVVDSGHGEPSMNTPFMKTRELFLIKAGPQDRLDDYRESSPEKRLAILKAIESPALPEEQVQTAFAGAPVALDVEWFASAADLAALFAFMRETADPAAFEIMAINSGATEGTRAHWDYIGYKGGSEPGVLNFTWLVTDDSGRDHALVLSWTNSEANIDESTLNLIAMRILAL